MGVGRIISLAAIFALGLATGTGGAALLKPRTPPDITLTHRGAPPANTGRARTDGIHAPRVLAGDALARLTAQPALWGEAPRADDLRGNVVVVTFFASWCPPCREELAKLAQLHAKHATGGLRVVAINYFEEWEGVSDDAKLALFLERVNMPFPAVRGDKAMVDWFGGVRYIPTLFVFDRTGAQVHAAENPGAELTMPGMEELEAMLTRLLAG